MLSTLAREFKIGTSYLIPFAKTHVFQNTARMSSGMPKTVTTQSESAQFDDKQITIKIKDGGNLTVSTCWLRDNCNCPKCFQRQQRSLHRLGNSFLPKVSQIVSADGEGGRLNIKWADGHMSNYDTSCLSQHIVASMKRPEITERFLWTRETLTQARPQTFIFDDVINNATTLKELVKHIFKFGFCEVVESPVERASLSSVLNKVGGTMSTLFSEANDATMDLTNNDLQNDLGWSNKRVPAHTDFTFYHNPSALVGLHLLQHNGKGGDFAIVDGFQIAEKFRREQPEVFKHMVYSPVMWKYITAEQEERLISTILKLDPSTGACHQIKWSAVYICPLHTESVAEIESLYSALEKIYYELHVNEENRCRFVPEPGRITIFDNWRMIHERASDFTGDRIMHVGDVPRDAWISKARLLNLM